MDWYGARESMSFAAALVSFISGLLTIADKIINFFTRRKPRRIDLRSRRTQLAVALLLVSFAALASGFWFVLHKPSGNIEVQSSGSRKQTQTTAPSSPQPTKLTTERRPNQHKVIRKVQQHGSRNQQTAVQAPISQSNTGGCNQQVVGGNNNINNCNALPVVTASAQIQQETGDPKAPWVVLFTITTTSLTQTGDLRLTCSGPVIKAGISRINPMEFISGTNGADPNDPDTVVYELGPEMLSPGKVVRVAVYSRQPIKVLSGSIGPNRIHF